MLTHVYGIDPGLVHTGVVRMTFDNGKRTVSLGSTVIDGDKPHLVKNALGLSRAGTEHVFIEAYRPRSHYDSDERMVVAVREIHKLLPGSKVINNTGATRVIRRPLMELLHVWKWSTVTHHQDLRAAARIGLYGMVKDEDLNKILAAIVYGHCFGTSWNVLD